MRLKADTRLRFAGQITGCEGYVESASMGLLAGRFAAEEWHGMDKSIPPVTTAFGALLSHITGGHLATEEVPGKRSFQPMNINFGLFPPVPAITEIDGRRLRGKEKTIAKRQSICKRALVDFEQWLQDSKSKVAA